MSTSKRAATKAIPAMIAAMLAVALDAGAHGGLPRAYDILHEPRNEAHVLLRSDLWGYFESRDAGGTWNYVCAESWGALSTSLENRSMAIMPGGRVLVAASYVGLRVTDDTCNWRSAPQFDGEVVSSVVGAPEEDGVVFAVTSTVADGGGDGQVWRSQDRGDTWAPWGTKLPGDFLARSLAIPPSRPRRLYVVGNLFESTSARFLRSDDDGATWDAFELPVARDDWWTPRIASVHPTDPDTVFVRIDGVEGYGENTPDEIWSTTDGGSRWSRVFAGTGDLPGTAIDTSSGNLFIAGPLEGLQVASVDGALSGGQTTFRKALDGQFFGLKSTPGGLLAGGNNYAAAGVPAYTLGRSTDQGKTFESLMTMCDVRFPSCPAGSTVHDLCKPIWEGDGVGRGMKEEYITSRCGAAGPPANGDDAGAGTERSTNGSSRSGCGCTMAGVASSRGGLVTTPTFLLGVWRRRRRTAR